MAAEIGERRLDVSVWAKRQARFVPFRVCTEREVARLRATYPDWVLRSAPFDVVEIPKPQRGT